MEPVSFVFATAQAADLCFSYSKTLMETYKSYKHAEVEIGDRMLHVARQCHSIYVQLDFMRRIEDSLSQQHKAIQTMTLEAFTSRMRIVLSKLNSLFTSPLEPDKQDSSKRINKLKYIIQKTSLDEAIADLDRWQKDYDPSWFLMVKVASSHIDQGLDTDVVNGLETNKDKSLLMSAKNIRDCTRDPSAPHLKVFLPEKGLKGVNLRNIPHCSAKYLQRPGSKKWLLVDRIKCSGFADPNLTLKDVRMLGAQLSNIDPSRFGILKCYGVIKRLHDNNTTISSFDFVFEAPCEIETPPKTLRSHLLVNTRHTLTQRFNTATQLARAVSYVHTLGYVHKNVRPEHVVSFPGKDESLGSFFLIGFDQARILERGTILAGDPRWEKDLYRHPDRQGLKPKESYIMQHDIYSLGVCLLEIGLWESIVEYEADSKVAKATKTLGKPTGETERWQPSALKERLVDLARDLLPLHMGERYADVVVNCLTCLDSDNVDFGDPREFEDEDGVLVAVRYIEKASPHKVPHPRIPNADSSL